MKVKFAEPFSLWCSKGQQVFVFSMATAEESVMTPVPDDDADAPSRDSNPKKAPSRSDSGDLASTDCDSNASRSVPVSPSANSSLSDEELSPTSKANKKRWADLAEEEEEHDCWSRVFQEADKSVSSEATKSSLRPTAAEFVMGQPAEVGSQGQSGVSEDVAQALNWVKMLEGYDCWPYNRFSDPENSIAVVSPPANFTPPSVQAPLQPPWVATTQEAVPAVSPLTPVAPVMPHQAAPNAYPAVTPVPAPQLAPPPAPPIAPPMVNPPMISPPDIAPGSVQETLYRVAYIGGLDLRVEPNYAALRTGLTLRHNEVFAVSQEIAGADGRTYLHLSDGRGWAFDDSALIPHDPSVKKGGWAPLLQAVGCPPTAAPAAPVPAPPPAPAMWPTPPTATDQTASAPGSWLAAEHPQRMFSLSACV